MGSRPEEPSEPYIGHNIPWKLIEGELFRIAHFTSLAAVVEGRMQAPSAPLPYALLRVESPVLNQPALMPVNHRNEFLNLRDIYEGTGVPVGWEMLVSHLPYRGFLGPLIRLTFPRLHLRLARAGELESYYSDERHWRRPAAREYFFPKGITGRCSCGAKLYTFVVRCARCDCPVLEW